MNLQTQTLRYPCGSTEHVGYLAWDPQAKEPRPGIVVIHEWWGVNDYIRGRVRQLAERGYCVLAIDMYGEGKTATTPDEAGAAMNAVLEDMVLGTKRLRAGYDALLSISGVDAERTAAVGYCFGGAMSLHMTRIGMPLRAAVSFHGSLGSFHPPTPGEMKARVLVCHGEMDAMVSMEDLATFRGEMDAAHADYDVMVHAGAMHGFTSREADDNGRKFDLPLGYHADADRDSWQAMIRLFDQVF